MNQLENEKKVLPLCKKSQILANQKDLPDLSLLAVEEHRKVRSLLEKYVPVFSAHEGDMGCTELITHEIPLLDDVPVRQWYRCITPSDYDSVKKHINLLLEL